MKLNLISSFILIGSTSQYGGIPYHLNEPQLTGPLKIGQSVQQFGHDGPREVLNVLLVSHVHSPGTFFLQWFKHD